MEIKDLFDSKDVHSTDIYNTSSKSPTADHIQLSEVDKGLLFDA
jgi:hypothetical protein